MSESKRYFPRRHIDTWVTVAADADVDMLERCLVESFRINEVPAHLLKTLDELRAADMARAKLCQTFAREVATAMCAVNAAEKVAKYEMQFKRAVESSAIMTTDVGTLPPAA